MPGQGKGKGGTMSQEHSRYTQARLDILPKIGTNIAAAGSVGTVGPCSRLAETIWPGRQNGNFCRRGLNSLQPGATSRGAGRERRESAENLAITPTDSG